MDQQQLPPLFNTQGPPPNGQQGQWQPQNMQAQNMQAQNMQPMPPGYQNLQQQMPGPQNPQQNMPGAHHPQQQHMPGPQNPQQQQQPLMTGVQSPRPQQPQAPPVFATAQTPDINALYPQNHPPLSQQDPLSALAEQQRMFQGPQRPVGTPVMVPPGAIPLHQQAQQSTPGPFGPPPPQQQGSPFAQASASGGRASVHPPQQSQHGTPVSFAGAAGPFAHPSQQHTPQPPSFTMSSAPISVHGGPPGVQPLQQTPISMPMGANHLSGLDQHPPSVYGGNPIAQPAPAGAAPGGPPWAQASQTPSFAGGSQAAGANASRPNVLFDENTSRELEALQDEMFNLRMRDAKVATANDPKAQLSWEEVKEESRKAKWESWEAYQTSLLKQWAEEAAERARLRGDGGGQGGGGSQRGAANAAPKAKRCSLAKFTIPRKEPARKDPPSPSLVTPAPLETEQAPVPSASKVPNEEDGGVALGEQPATQDVDVERTQSPTGSPSRSQRRHRRRDPALSGRRPLGAEATSSQPRRNGERWRRAGMYYETGETVVELETM